MIKGQEQMGDLVSYLTPEELKTVRTAIRSAIDLRKKYVRPEMATAYASEPQYGRKAKRMKVELPLLQSALKKLK